MGKFDPLTTENEANMRRVWCINVLHVSGCSKVFRKQFHLTSWAATQWQKCAGFNKSNLYKLWWKYKYNSLWKKGIQTWFMKQSEETRLGTVCCCVEQHTYSSLVQHNLMLGDFNQLNYYLFWKMANQLCLSAHVCLRRGQQNESRWCHYAFAERDISEKVVTTCRSCREGSRRGEITNLNSFIKSCGIEAWGVLHKHIYWMQKWLETAS